MAVCFQPTGDTTRCGVPEHLQRFESRCRHMTGWLPALASPHMGDRGAKVTTGVSQGWQSRWLHTSRGAVLSSLRAAMLPHEGRRRPNGHTRRAERCFQASMLPCCRMEGDTVWPHPSCGAVPSSLRISKFVNDPPDCYPQVCWVAWLPLVHMTAGRNPLTRAPCYR